MKSLIKTEQLARKLHRNYIETTGPHQYKTRPFEDRSPYFGMLHVAEVDGIQKYVGYVGLGCSKDNPYWIEIGCIYDHTFGGSRGQNVRRLRKLAHNIVTTGVIYAEEPVVVLYTIAKMPLQSGYWTRPFVTWQIDIRWVTDLVRRRCLIKQKIPSVFFFAEKNDER